MMALLLRGGLLVMGLLAAVLGIGYYLQQPWALQTWPWSEGRLSYIFVSSILAAVAATMLWVGLAGRLAAAAGGFVHVATLAGGLVTVFLPLALQADRPRLAAYAAASAGAALACLAAFAWVRRLPPRDARRLPLSLRLWSGLYLLILIPAGTALIAQVPGIMPWPLKPEMSMVCGWVFVSAACSFAYPLLRPQVEYVRVGLIGFLAYDLVLIMPFVQHLDRVPPHLLGSLRLYLLALVASAAVSLYYLFWCPATRWQARPAAERSVGGPAAEPAEG